MAATKKAKAPAIAVPQTDAAADMILKSYGEAGRDLERIETELEAEIAKLKAEAETKADPLKEQLKTQFAQLQAFGGAHRDRLTTDGKTKTVIFPAGKIGWRQAPPSVQYDKGLKSADIVAAIKRLRDRLARSKLKPTRQLAFICDTFLRPKVEVSKEAMLAKPDLANQVRGVTVRSIGEEFFVEPLSVELAQAAE